MREYIIKAEESGRGFSLRNCWDYDALDVLRGLTKFCDNEDITLYRVYGWSRWCPIAEFSKETKEIKEESDVFGFTKCEYFLHLHAIKTKVKDPNILRRYAYGIYATYISNLKKGECFVTSRSLFNFKEREICGTYWICGDYDDAEKGYLAVDYRNLTNRQLLPPSQIVYFGLFTRPDHNGLDRLNELQEKKEITL